MTAVAKFPSFVPSFRRLKENQNKMFTIEFYHHDNSSEPTFSASTLASEVVLEDTEDEGLFITLYLAKFTLTFGERNYNTNLSNDDVVFSSKFDDETYCFISFS